MQVVVELALVEQLRVLRGHALRLDRHLQVGLGVDCLEDLPEGALADLLDDLEVLAHFLQLHDNDYRMGRARGIILNRWTYRIGHNDAPAFLAKKEKFEGKFDA